MTNQHPSFTRFFDLAANPAQYDGRVAWSPVANRPQAIRQAVLQLLPGDKSGAGNRVLDIGCGAGWLCGSLSENGAATIGIDPSEKLIATAKEQYPELDFQCATLENFQSPRHAFDLVTCIMAIEHVNDLASWFRKIASVTRPGGKVFIICPAYTPGATLSRSGVRLETIDDGNGTLVMRVDKGENGELYNIVRAPKLIIEAARDAGLSLSIDREILAEAWPGYTPEKSAPDKPILHIFEFAA